MRELTAEQNKKTAGTPPPANGAQCHGITPRQRMLKAMQCLPVDRPPMWLMRQAGRCLPEYRDLKKEYSFRDLVQSPRLAAEVTLQPIRRFGFDAAILFSDILVVPEAMGQGFTFREPGGVEMNFALRDKDDILGLTTDGVANRLQYVADAIKLIKTELAGRTALLGFAGSPWTLANFMLEGGSATNHGKALALFHYEPGLFAALAEKLTAAVTDFLNLQIAAGVDAIQIFDSLGGLLPPNEFEAASGQWMARIIAALDKKAPVIVYSKGTRAWKSLLRTGAQVIGIDHGIDLGEAAQNIPREIAVQGNFNPEVLRTAGPGAVAAEANRLLHRMRHRNGYIFNLGHGVPPDASLENLQALANAVQNFV
jgi:uroporphyrinogen decarboxylase